MPAAYATAADVEAGWRPLTEHEQRGAPVLIAQASALLRSRVATIDALITAMRLDPLIVTIVIVDAVRDAMSNPERRRSQSVGPFTDTYLSSGSLVITAEHIETILAAVRPAAPIPGAVPVFVGVGSIRLVPELAPALGVYPPPFQ